MKHIILGLVFALMGGLVCHAQTPGPATANELEFLQFMLMNLASPDHHADAIKMYEDSLGPQFGLNTQEVATIHAAALALKPVLLQFRSSVQSVTSGTTMLTDSDTKAINALVADRNSQIAALANRILLGVRAETADRLRVPGNTVSAAVKAAQGGK